MKTLSFVVASLAGASGCALGLPALAQPPAAGPAPDTADWNGPYVGLNLGWTGANSQARAGSATTNQLTGVSAGAGPVSVPSASFPTAQMNYSSDGVSGGGQVGYNRQMGHVVVGLEGDMEAVGGRARQFSSYALPATALTSANTVTIDRATDPNWTASVRGRVGWATGPVLLYGTGGLALADVRQSAFYTYAPTVTAAVAAANPGTTLGPFANGSSAQSVLTGWTVGGGAEYRLNRAVSIGAEYRHADYGHSTYFLGSGGPGAISEAARIGFADDQVLAKVNFRFGPTMF
jgi:outer membrane immunogenic protein